MVEVTDLSEGTAVELTYLAMSRTMGRERRTLSAEVVNVEGKIVTITNPYGDENSWLLVDPDDEVWERSYEGDSFRGKNAELAVVE